MAIKGSLFQTYGKIVAETVEAARGAAKDELLRGIEAIITEEMDKFFPRVLRTMNRQKTVFKNDWMDGTYTVPALDHDYFLEKQINYGAANEQFFIGRSGLSKNSTKVYLRGKNKGQPRHDYQRSLHFLISRLAKRSGIGKLIFSEAGGIGVTTKTKSGIDPSKGALVDGKPKKFGVRGGLINARWQDIVSDEYVRLSKLKRAKLPAGYRRSSNEDWIITDAGRRVSLNRLVAEGKVTVNIQGSFFKNIREDRLGFLTFLSKKTDLLIVGKGTGLGTAKSKSKTYVRGKLWGLAEENRLLLDPVFGDVLEIIRRRVKKLAKEVSSRG